MSAASWARAAWLGLGLAGLGAAQGCAEDDDAAETAEEELFLRKGAVDHAGIVEISTMMLAGQPTARLLDPYNQENPFGIRSAAYLETFVERLRKFDAYDDRTDFTPAQTHAWAARLASGNYLVVDTSKPCVWKGGRTYLEIERAALAGRPHATCGGRMPNEDALDVTLDFLVRGPDAAPDDPDALRDGVDGATKPAVDVFPYLAEMN